jgi:hypothetical protein
MLRLVGVKLSILTLALLTGCLTACSQHTPPAAPVSPPVFKFDYEKTSELLLSKADPQTGDHWTARFVHPENGDWTIALAPDGKTLGDQHANSSFIEHVLDTIRTAKSKPAPLSGTLESFGLSVPRFHLEWKAPTVADTAADTNSNTMTSFDLRLGSATLMEDDGQTLPALYSSTGGEAVFVTTGAVLEMLSRVNSFEVLRHTQLLIMPPGETADDVDTIQIGKTFSAQRQGDDWVTPSKHKIRGNTTAFLQQLAHLRILSFIDDPAENQRLLKIKPLVRITLKDHKEMPVQLDLRIDNSKTYATVSTRLFGQDLAVFEVYPDVLTWVRALTPL